MDVEEIIFTDREINRKAAKIAQMLTSRVFKVVSRIPEGKVLTYGEVSKRTGKPLASRAVGRILSKNYDPKIPCHRVIRSDGKLGGYNRGIAEKLRILKEEGIEFEHGKCVRRKIRAIRG